MHEPDFLRFASDATLIGLAGGALLMLAFVSGLGERRRKNRQQVDAVGCMPWTTLSILTFFPGAVLVAMAVVGWLNG